MKIIWKVLIVLALVLSVLNTFMDFTSSNEAGYIDINRAFAEFNYTQEVQSEVGQVKLKRKQILDSLQYLIETTREKTPESDELRGLESQYVSKANYFEDHQTEIMQKSEEKVWGQINAFAKSFGDKKNCTIIIGANGTGNLMYGDPRQDFTDEFIEYINNRYEDN